MLTQETAAQFPQIQIWSIDRLVFYARNPRKNDSVVDRMCSSIREFGFKIPVLARSDGEVVDGHLRLKAGQKLRITEVPVILCDEWAAAQVKAFRLMVNRSVTWAPWDDELLALELQELNEADFELSLTGFDPKEIDDLLLDPGDDDQANAAPPLPENAVSRLGDLWLCGPHRVLGGDARSSEAVARLLEDRAPSLLVTDPPYGIELDGEWRDRAGLNGCGPAETSYMKKRTEGHTETTSSGDTRADWSEAFELVPSLQPPLPDEFENPKPAEPVLARASPESKGLARARGLVDQIRDQALASGGPWTTCTSATDTSDTSSGPDTGWSAMWALNNGSARSPDSRSNSSDRRPWRYEIGSTTSMWNSRGSNGRRFGALKTLPKQARKVYTFPALRVCLR